MVNKNMIKICGFLNKYEEKYNNMHQWKQFKACVYPLSNNEFDRNSEKGKTLDIYKLPRIFSYKFNNLCYEAVADDKLESDINRLVLFRYIDRKREQRKSENEYTEHYTYTLTDQGKNLATYCIDLFGGNPDNIKAINTVIEQVEGKKAEEIISTYAENWCEHMYLHLKEDRDKISTKPIQKRILSFKSTTWFTALYVLPYKLNESTISNLINKIENNLSNSKLVKISNVIFDRNQLSADIEYKWEYAMHDYGEHKTKYSQLIDDLLKNFFRFGKLSIYQQGLLTLSYPIQVSNDLDWFGSYIRDIFIKILRKPLWTINIMDWIEEEFPTETSEEWHREFWPCNMFLGSLKYEDLLDEVINAIERYVDYDILNMSPIEFSENFEINLILKISRQYQSRIQELFNNENQRAINLDKKMEGRIRYFEHSLSPEKTIQLLTNISQEVRGYL